MSQDPFENLLRRIGGLVFGFGQHRPDLALGHAELLVDLVVGRITGDHHLSPFDVKTDLIAGPDPERVQQFSGKRELAVGVEAGDNHQVQDRRAPRARQSGLPVEWA